MCPPPTPLPRPMVTTMKNGREKEVVVRPDLVIVADLVIVISFYVTIAGRIIEPKQ